MQREDLMAAIDWPRLPRVRVIRDDTGRRIFAFTGRPAVYRIHRQERGQMTRDAARILNGDDLRTFHQTWGPLGTEGLIHREDRVRRAAYDLADAVKRGESPDVDAAVAEIDSAEPLIRPDTTGPIYEEVGRAVHHITTLQAARELALQGDEPARDYFVELLRSADPRFADEGLRVELVPRTLIHIIALGMLEEVESVGPVLTCLAYPAKGCRVDVPERKGARGRRPLYCSRRCSDIARARRMRARRRARKESTS